MAVKIKPLTSEIIDEISEKSGLDVKAIRNMFYTYWQDLSICFTSAAPYSIHVENLGTFYLSMKSKAFLKDREKRILRVLTYIPRIQKRLVDKPDVLDKVLQRFSRRINKLISDIIIYEATLKLYEDEVRSQYPKKYKADLKAVEASMARLQKLFNFPLASIQISISYQIQEIYVQKLSQAGLLRNTVVRIARSEM